MERPGIRPVMKVGGEVTYSNAGRPDGAKRNKSGEGNKGEKIDITFSEFKHYLKLFFWITLCLFERFLRS